MAIGYPFNRYRTMSKPEEPEYIRREPLTQEILTSGNKECNLCEEYKKMIEFQKNIILIIIGGVIIKMILDSFIRN